jgi:hypothetical protein
MEQEDISMWSASDDDRDMACGTEDASDAGVDRFNYKEFIQLKHEQPITEYADVGTKLLEDINDFNLTIPEPVLDLILAKTGFHSSESNV